MNVSDLLNALGTFGPPLAAAVVCGLVSLAFALTDFLSLSELDVTLPAPLEWLFYVTFGVPLIAALGAAVLVGPAPDLIGFARAIVGVLAGVGTWFVAATVGDPVAPSEQYLEFSDGRKLRGEPAVRFLEAHSWDEIHDMKPGLVAYGCGRVRRWRPSTADFVRFAVARIGGPLASVVVAVVVADWSL